MLSSTFLLAFFAIVSLLVGETEAYAIQHVARSLSGFEFPTIHVGPVPTPTGQIGTGTVRTSFFTTHITKTIVVPFLTTSVSRERSLDDMSTRTKTEATVTLSGSSISTKTTTGDISELTGIATSIVPRPTSIITSTTSSATAATASGMSRASVSTSISHSHSRNSVLASLKTVTTQSALRTIASQGTSSVISYTPSVTPTSLPLPPSKSVANDISAKIGITFGVTVLVVALFLWLWLVVLPKSKARKAEAAAAKGSRTRQQKWWNWIRAERDRPWVRQPRARMTEEVGFDLPTRSALDDRSAPQAVEPTPRVMSAGSWPLRSDNKNPHTETIQFPQPLIMDRLNFRRRVRALEEAAEKMVGTLSGLPGIARGASTKSSSSVSTRPSSGTFDTEFSGPRVAGIPSEFENPYPSSRQDGKENEPSNERKVQPSSAAQNPTVMYVAGKSVSPVSPISVVISLSRLSEVSRLTDVDLD